MYLSGENIFASQATSLESTLTCQLTQKLSLGVSKFWAASHSTGTGHNAFLRSLPFSSLCSELQLASPLR